MISCKNVSFLILFLWHVCCLHAQKGKKPVARFSFNDNAAIDEVSRHPARLSGTMFVEDRFGNSNNAVLLLGSLYSYINLGSYKALKPDSGTISLWIQIENDIMSGIGPNYNPIILTKNSADNDYYEAYGIYYMFESGRIVGVSTLDYNREVTCYSKVKLNRNTWHHIAFVYNDDYNALYIDGKFEMKLAKKFRTKFLDSDSVVIGSTANIKNKRFLNGAVDDVEFYDRVLNEPEILELYDAPDPKRLEKLVYFWFWRGIIIAGFAFFCYFIIRYRLQKELQKEKQQLELTNKILETDLRVNRALMNPHFVFNSLNSLQNFIMSKDYLQANNYLVKFSKLMRKLLESNTSNTISLEQEIEMLTTYMDLEDVRFEKGINYSIETDQELLPSQIEIPVMLLQPFIENAIWHGLLKKTGEKILNIRFSKDGDKYIQCIIEDNGIGRAKAAGNTISNKKSFATIFVMQRLELLNKIYDLNCTLTVTNRSAEEGTVIIIKLPILKNTLYVAFNNNR